MGSVMQLPNLGSFGGPRQHGFAANDWQLPSPSGLGPPPPGAGGDVAAAMLRGSKQGLRPMVALQEGTLPLGDPSPQPQPSQPHLQQPQPNGDVNAWLQEMFGGRGGRWGEAGGGGSSLLPGAGGNPPPPQQQQAQQEQQHHPQQPQQHQAHHHQQQHQAHHHHQQHQAHHHHQQQAHHHQPSIQHQQRQPQPQQRGPAAGAGGLPAGLQSLGGGAGRGLGAQKPQHPAPSQQELWRKGLFSEVFDTSARPESPFNIPDLADIEAPDMDDLLIGNIGLGDPLDPFQLPGTSPTGLPAGGQPGAPAPFVGSGGSGTGGTAGLALTHQLHAGRGQAAAEQEQGRGVAAGLAAAALQQRPASGSPLLPSQQQHLQQQQQQQQQQPYFDAQPGPPHQAAAAAAAPAITAQQQLAARLLPPGGAARKGGSKKVTSKKATASKKRAAPSATAALVAAAKRACTARGELVTQLEWYTEEEAVPVPQDEPLPPARPFEASALRLSPAAALVAAAAPAAAEDCEPETAARAAEHGPSRPANPQEGGHTQQRSRSPAAQGAGPLPPVLGWLFGGCCPPRWGGQPTAVQAAAAAGGGLHST